MFKIGQKAQLTIQRYTPTGTVVHVEPAKKQGEQWVTISFEDGSISCYHSTNLKKSASTDTTKGSA